MSRVDVVVPCYNYARFLDRCVGSLLDQQGAEVRVLVIDDASADDTPEVGQRIAAADGRVEFRRHATNRGHIATYNEGLLGWATGDYSLLISADDMLAPGALARATRLMDQAPEVGMTYGMALVIRDEQGPPAEAPATPEEQRILPGAEFVRHCFERAYCPVSTPTAIVRTAVQHAVGGYSPELPHSADLEMWMRFAARGPIGVLRSLQAYYRWHAANMGGHYYTQVVGDRREFLLTCRRMSEQLAQSFPDAARWMTELERHVAEEAVRSANRSLEQGEPEACAAWVGFAEEVWPGVRETRNWSRLKAKRALGAGVWKWVRPLVNRLRGAPKASVQASHFRGFQPGQQIGWWPGTP